MKTTGAIGARRADMAQHKNVSYLHGPVQRVAIHDTLSRLEQALRQVDDLERALASSRQDSATAQRQIERLSKANAQLTGLAVQREGARGAAQCSAGELTELSLSAGLDPHEMLHIERLLAKRIRFRKGDVLYRFGDGFDALYAIRSGSCKTVLLARDGQDQITGYHIVGDIFGMDGIGQNFHECQTTALEDMEVWRLPFDRIENLARCSDRFRRNLHKLLSQECSRAQTLMLVLGTMRAGKRVAIFLLELSQRYRARGFSSNEFVLRMSRAEIGSYLGLKLETVSRQFARFQREGLIQVEGRLVKLLDRATLSGLSDRDL